MKVFLSVIAGLVLGCLIVIIGALKLKYMLAFCVLVFFPFFIYYVGSLKKALMVILIFSLSTQMSFNPFYSEYYVQPDMGVRISLTGLVLLAAYGLWLLSCFNGKDRVRFFPKTTLPLLLMVLFSGVSIFYARKPNVVPFLFLQATEGLLCYFYAANFVRKKEDMLFILKWTAITIVVTAMITIIQYFKPGFLNLKFMGWSDEPLKLHYANQVISRPSAFLGHANNLAAYLVSWLPLFFVFLITTKSIIKKHWLEFFAFILGLCALILTFSRGGWLSFTLSVSLVVGIILYRRYRVALPDIIPRLMVLALGGIMLAAPFSPNIIRRLTRDDYQAGSSRIRLAKNALRVFWEEPLHGVGLGYYLDFIPIPPHNIYLQTAVELGVIGFALFMWLSYGFFKQGLSSLKESDDLVVLLFSIGVFAGLASAYLHGMVELGTIAYHKFLTYLFVGGILVALGERQNMKGIKCT